LARLAAEKPDAIGQKANWGRSGGATNLTIHTNSKSSMKLTALVPSIDILI